MRKYFVFCFVFTQFYRHLKRNVAILINKRQQRHVMTFKYISQQAPQHLRSEASQNLPAQTESHSSPIRCHPADGRVGTDGEKISLFKATLRLCLDPQLHCALSNLIKRRGFVRPACSSEFILLLKSAAGAGVSHHWPFECFGCFFLLPFLSVYLADGKFSTVTAPPSLWPFLCCFLFSYFYTIDEFMLSVTQFRFFFFQCVQKKHKSENVCDGQWVGATPPARFGLFPLSLCWDLCSCFVTLKT